MPEPSTNPDKYPDQLESMKRGVLFLLPIEVDTLMDKVASLVERQNELGALLGEAMSEGAETYHDNAPAEAVVSDSSIVVAEFNSIAKALRYAERIDYPHETGKIVIGSVVTLVYDGDADSERLFLTGFTRNVDLSNVTNEVDIQPLAAGSPLGMALLDKTAGSEAHYSVEDRDFRVDVLAIDPLLQTKA